MNYLWSSAKNSLRYLTCDIPENAIGFIERNADGKIIYDYLNNNELCKIKKEKCFSKKKTELEELYNNEYLKNNDYGYIDDKIKIKNAEKALNDSLNHSDCHNLCDDIEEPKGGKKIKNRKIFKKTLKKNKKSKTRKQKKI